MDCLALFHVAFENLGSFEPVLREAGFTVRYRHAGAGASHAEWTGAPLVVVLGGPLGAADRDDYPWLADEVEGLRARLALGLPTLGICLGAQLMALALGGAVERRAAGAEIGWGPLTLAGEAGPLDALSGVPVLHWHGDNIVAPPGARVAAATPGTPCQAFTFGAHALGLQFHAEFADARIEEWLSGHAVELRKHGVKLDRLRADTRRHAGGLQEAGAALLRRWLAELPC